MEIGAPGRPRLSYWNLADTMPRYLADYEHAVRPVPSTIPKLDEMLKGGFRPGVHFVGGNTGAGKTALCLWMAQRIASMDDPDTGERYGVTFISLELSSSEVRSRMGSRLSYHMDDLEAFSWTDFEEYGARTNEFVENETYDPAHDPVYMADMELVSQCPRLRIVDGVADGSANNLMNVCMEIEATGNHGGRVCMVDYLQCIDVAPGLDETEAMKEAVRSINLAGMRSGVAVIVIAAVSRVKGTEMRKAKHGENPGADIFRGSSWIEYTGLTAMALVRREDARRTGDFVEVELCLVKNRRGSLGEPLRLAYGGAYGEFVAE